MTINTDMEKQGDALDNMFDNLIVQPNPDVSIQTQHMRDGMVQETMTGKHKKRRRFFRDSLSRKRSTQQLIALSPYNQEQPMRRSFQLYYSKLKAKEVDDGLGSKFSTI